MNSIPLVDLGQFTQQIVLAQMRHLFPTVATQLTARNVICVQKLFSDKHEKLFVDYLIELSNRKMAWLTRHCSVCNHGLFFVIAQADVVLLSAHDSTITQFDHKGDWTTLTQNDTWQPTLAACEVADGDSVIGL